MYYLQQEKSSFSRGSIDHLLIRLKSFFIKLKAGALEINLESEESYARFKEITDASRPFLSCDRFLKATKIESIVLSYLFLEYRLKVDYNTLNKAIS